MDPQDRLVLRDPAGSLFRAHRVLLGRREREERSVQPDRWVFLEAQAPLAETAPRERGVYRVIMDLRDDRDLLDPLDPREHLELQDQVGHQGLKGIKDFLVLLVPKEIREKEVMCNPKLRCVPSHGKCVNSSSRATCLAITPS